MLLLYKRNSRFAIIHVFLLIIVFVSFITRLFLLFFSFGKAGLGGSAILQVFAKGLIFDIGAALFFSMPGILYFLLFPAKYIGKRLDRALVYTGLFLSLFILSFTFFAEFTFWDEFESRFNFIAVDYLVYTYEVISNINQSYPLPLLILGMLALAAAGLFVIVKTGALKVTFATKSVFPQRLKTAIIFILIAIVYVFFIPNRWAESSGNRYQQELSKNGIYAFFAAFRQN